MKAFALVALALVIYAGAASAYELDQAGWVQEHNCQGRGRSAHEETWCEDYGGAGSPGESWLQRANIEERIAKIRASISSLLGPGLFKPSAEID